MRPFAPLASLVLVTSLHASVVINFDDRPGQDPPFSTAQLLQPQYLVSNEYSPLGVVFNSAGGGIAILHAGNAPSAPNSAAATSPGPHISYSDNAEAVFAIGATPAIVDFVSLALSDSSAPTTLSAYAMSGAFLGSSSGGPGSTISVAFNGQIHRVVLSGGPFGFDDFTFDGLAAPSPASASLLIAAAGLAVRRRRPAHPTAA